MGTQETQLNSNDEHKASKFRILMRVQKRMKETKTIHVEGEHELVKRMHTSEEN